MKIGVLGGVVEGKVNVDVMETAPFSDIFNSIQEAVGKGPLWDKFNLHVAEVQDRKVRPGVSVIKPTDTPKSLGLPPTGALVVLRARGPVTPAAVSPNDVSEATTSGCGNHRNRLIAIYEKYEPAKVGTVDATLKKFKGKEEAVIRQLVKKYGPEPVESDTRIVPVSPVVETQQTTTGIAEEPKVEYRDRLIAIYEKYEPAKVGTVDATLKKFKGKEEAVIRQLVKKYGPEPDAAVKSIAPPSSLPSSTFLSARDDNTTATPPPTTPPVEEGKKDNDEGKYDRNMVNATINRIASTKNVHVSEPIISGNVPSSVKCENAVTFKKDQPEAVSPVSQPYLEPYGFQKNYISPSNHALLEEPISETDANSGTDKCDETDSGPALSLKRTKDDAVRAASAVLNQDNFDTGKKLLRDLEYPWAKSRHDRSGVTTSNTAAELISSKRHRPTVTDPRYARIVHKAVVSIGDAAESTVRRAYWTKWLYRVAQQKANSLLHGKVWARTSGGARLADNVPHAYVVEDLGIYIYERLLCSSRGLPIFSDTLQKALRGLLYTAREYRKASEGEDPTSALFFADKELCPVGDTNTVAAALTEATVMIRELAECKAQLHAHQKRLALMVDERDAMCQELATAETFAGRLVAAQDELSKTQARLEQAEEQSRHAQEELTTMRYSIQNLQRELKKERSSAPAHNEPAAQQRDASVVVMHQELARTRTRLHREQAERENLAKQLEEVKREASRAVQSRAGEKTHSAFGEAKTSASMRTPGKNHSVAEKSKLPRGIFSSHFPAGRVIDEEFQPSTARELNNMTDIELVHENMRLEAKLHRSSLREEVDFGFCPHCVTQLTACAAERNGLPDNKAAFCFSCRKSFTFKDIHERDRHVEQMERMGRGLSRRGPLVSHT